MPIDPKTGRAYYSPEEILEAPRADFITASVELVKQLTAPSPGETAEDTESRDTIRNTIHRLLMELANADGCHCFQCSLRRWREVNDSPAGLAVVLDNITADHTGAVHLSVNDGDTAKAALPIIIKALQQVLADVEAQPLEGSGVRSINLAKETRH